jgi:hypothetical protein
MVLEGLVEYNLVPQEMFELMKEAILENDGQMTEEQYAACLAIWYSPAFQNKNWKLH